jgi:hypothetical protein
MSEVSQLLQAAAAAGQQQLLLMGLRAQFASRVQAVYLSKWAFDDSDVTSRMDQTAKLIAELSVRHADALIAALHQPPAARPTSVGG